MLEIRGIEKCFMDLFKSRSTSFYFTKFPILIKGGVYKKFKVKEKKSQYLTLHKIFYDFLG